VSQRLCFVYSKAWSACLSRVCWWGDALVWLCWMES